MGLTHFTPTCKLCAAEKDIAALRRLVEHLEKEVEKYQDLAAIRGDEIRKLKSKLEDVGLGPSR